jgi:hypothetical protein
MEDGLGSRCRRRSPRATLDSTCASPILGDRELMAVDHFVDVPAVAPAFYLPHRRTSSSLTSPTLTSELQRVDVEVFVAAIGHALTELRLQVEGRPRLRRCLHEWPWITGFRRIVRDEERLVVGILVNLPFATIAAEHARHRPVAPGDLPVQPDVSGVPRAPRKHDVLYEGDVRGMGHFIDYPA